MRTPRDPIYAGHRYPAEVISYAVWLYFRFPLSLRMVEEMLAARGISVTHETIRQWGLKFGREFANRIRRRAPRRGDKWHLDEVVVSFAGEMGDVKDWPAKRRRTALTVVGIGSSCRRKRQRKECHNQCLSWTHPHRRLPPKNVGPACREGLWNLTARLVHASRRQGPASPFRVLVAATHEPFLQSIEDLTVRQMAIGRVALIGDAAFIPPPHTAASTAQAAANALGLANALSRDRDI